MTWRNTKLTEKVEIQLEVHGLLSELLGKEMLQYILDLEDVIEDKRRLTKEIDIALNGDGAAEQASLCDILAQLKLLNVPISEGE